MIRMLSAAAAVRNVISAVRRTAAGGAPRPAVRQGRVVENHDGQDPAGSDSLFSILNGSHVCVRYRTVDG
jgi:hypothetical protein